MLGERGAKDYPLELEEARRGEQDPRSLAELSRHVLNMWLIPIG